MQGVVGWYSRYKFYPCNSFTSTAKFILDLRGQNLYCAISQKLYFVTRKGAIILRF